MDWIDWIVWACIFIAGYASKGAADEARYVKLPRARHHWECPHCPMRVGVSDRDMLAHVKHDHLVKMHPEVRS